MPRARNWLTSTPVDLTRTCLTCSECRLQLSLLWFPRSVPSPRSKAWLRCVMALPSLPSWPILTPRFSPTEHLNPVPLRQLKAPVLRSWAFSVETERWRSCTRAFAAQSPGGQLRLCWPSKATYDRPGLPSSGPPRSLASIPPSSLACRPRWRCRQCASGAGLQWSRGAMVGQRGGWPLVRGEPRLGSQCHCACVPGFHRAPDRRCSGCRARQRSSGGSPDGRRRPDAERSADAGSKPISWAFQSFAPKPRSCLPLARHISPAPAPASTRCMGSQNWSEAGRLSNRLCLLRRGLPPATHGDLRSDARG